MEKEQMEWSTMSKLLSRRSQSLISTGESVVESLLSGERV